MSDITVLDLNKLIARSEFNRQALVQLICADDCPDCRGHQKVDPHCATCKGRGWVDVLDRQWVSHVVEAYYRAAINPVMLPANGRMERALALVLNGNVHVDGEAISVTSSTDASKSYAIDGHDCTCPDSRAPVIAGRKACKHQIAAWLLLKAQAAK